MAAVVTALLSLAGGYWLARKQLRRMALRWDVESLGSVVAVKVRRPSSLRILLGDQELPTVFAYRVSMTNKGNTPLENLPFEIRAPGTSAVHVELAKTPTADAVQAEVVDQVVRGVIKLLNPKERAEATLWTAGRTKPEVHARASGLEVQTYRPTVLLGIEWLLLAACGFAAGQWAPIAADGYPDLAKIIVLFLGLAGTLAGFCALLGLLVWVTEWLTERQRQQERA